MHYGSNNKNKPLFMNGQQLIETESERDLGVIFSNNLKWKNQIIYCVSKANQMMGMIRKTFARLDPVLLSSLYLTFIRPFLEFAVPVWSPILIDRETLMLERVQHRATRLINSFRKLKYEDRDSS